ncbi:S8 family serine peptidase [Jatrophihabitans sp.]|uniref:S8 family serine peptidase n=1 Tax=Jatrophihabitans sp. TaxID=1932789 RepID=UPI0030C6B609|nr:Subtilase family protein [Jatrophihabitans sp.]
MRRLIAWLTVLAAVALMAGVGAPAASAAPGPADAPEYWFDSWRLQQLWDSGADGSGVTIAEIDTGVNAALPGLEGRVLAGTDLGSSGNGHVDRDKDAFGHGTAMASIMVSRPSSFDVTGIAPGAKILPIAVPLIGTTDAANDDHLAEAIRYAADHHAKIISMSLGGARTPSANTQACYSDEQAAIYYALRKGALLFASSGNSGAKGSPVEEPGVCLGVVSVGAVDRSGTVASFSSRHPYLTLTAPGVNIPSLGRIAGQAYSGEGTSQATAIASAAAAIVWSAKPKLTAEQLLTRLIATTDHHLSTHSTSYGYGIVNPYAAINDAVPANAPNPVFSLVAPFLARSAASSTSGLTSPPAATKHRAKPPGTVTVGSAPSRFGPRVIEGGLAGLLGLLALLALSVGGARRARQRVRLAVAARAAEHAPPPAPVMDAEGVEWHQL